MTPDHVAEPGGLPSLDAHRALTCCILAFGGLVASSPESSPFSWLAPHWRRLMEADDAAVPIIDPGEALQALRRSHRRQARVDLKCVHSTWLDRAGQDESPAVQRIGQRVGRSRHCSCRSKWRRRFPR